VEPTPALELLLWITIVPIPVAVVVKTLVPESLLKVLSFLGPAMGYI
jgi:hypothetical protein